MNSTKNFFPAYMENTVQVGGHCEARYNSKYLIGMLYVDGYKDNPIHLTAKSEEEMTDKIKEAASKFSDLVRDAEYLRKATKQN